MLERRRGLPLWQGLSGCTHNLTSPFKVRRPATAAATGVLLRPRQGDAQEHHGGAQAVRSLLPGGDVVLEVNLWGGRKQCSLWISFPLMPHQGGIRGQRWGDQEAGRGGRSRSIGQDPPHPILAGTERVQECGESIFIFVLSSDSPGPSLPHRSAAPRPRPSSGRY